MILYVSGFQFHHLYGGDLWGLTFAIAGFPTIVFLQIALRNRQTLEAPLRQNAILQGYFYPVNPGETVENLGMEMDGNGWRFQEKH